jgi:hypothetical protein
MTEHERGVKRLPGFEMKGKTQSKTIFCCRLLTGRPPPPRRRSDGCCSKLLLSRCFKSHTVDKGSSVSQHRGPFSYTCPGTASPAAGLLGGRGEAVLGRPMCNRWLVTGVWCSPALSVIHATHLCVKRSAQAVVLLPYVYSLLAGG